MPTWLTKWEPEDNQFWQESGKKMAWRTLIITTTSLILSFSTWFVLSAIVVRLPNIGFTFTSSQLFWLAAMPGLSGGTLRIIHTFLCPLFGSRHVITIATLLKIFPCIGLGLAIMNPTTPFWVFMLLAFSLGLGGGDFSSYMPSTRLFFPSRLQGTALGIQAGIGNFGVSVAQFLTPWIISFAALGALAGGPQVFTKGGQTSSVWMQNSVFIYVIPLIVMTVLAWLFIRSVPVKASFRQQLDIFKDRHTWYCTITYVMTFGSFAGFSAAFPLMIKTIYGVFPNAPDPLAYAFLGPLVGSAIRVFIGVLSDRFGGSIFTQVSGIGMIACGVMLIMGGYLTPTSIEQFPMFVVLMVSLFLFSGIGNASTFRQFPIIFAHSPRQSAGVIGWTAAMAAYGPFAFSTLIGASIGATGSAITFFWGVIGFWVIASLINFWFYTRHGKERWDFGTKWGTWWDAERRLQSTKSG